MKKYVAMCVAVLGLSYHAMACDDYAHGAPAPAGPVYTGGACTDADEMSRFAQRVKAKAKLEEEEATKKGITVSELRDRHALADRLAALRASAARMGLGCGDAFVRNPAVLGGK